MIGMIRPIVISCLAACLIASLAGVLHSTNVARVATAATTTTAADQPIVLYDSISDIASSSTTRKAVTKHVRQQSKTTAAATSTAAAAATTLSSQSSTKPASKSAVVDKKRKTQPSAAAAVEESSRRTYNERKDFTFDSFPVAGVNLADFGLFATEDKYSQQERDPTATTTPPFQLFSDFDLTSQIVGNETWTDLLRYRRDATFPSLSFYVDKIARKRWFPSAQVDSPDQFLLLYASELAQTLRSSSLSSKYTTLSTNTTSVPPIKPKQAQKAIAKYLPTGIDYAAKPTHLSCAGGVWLTKIVGNMTHIGHGKKPLVPAGDDFSSLVVAKDLAEQLSKVQDYCGSRVKESLALVNVQPGIMAEERFTSPFEGEDQTGGIEFKVFTIWGRMWLSVWRPGKDGAQAILHRNGTNLDWDGRSELLPDWIDWKRIVSIAEKLGANKDMFRTDIFVGVPANSPVLLKAGTSSREERLKAVRYVVSENEIHPTEFFHVSGMKDILEEGARLWLAGYRIGNYQVVPNDEVPEEFLSLGMLPSNVTIPSFEVAGVDLAQYRGGDGNNEKFNNIAAKEPPFELFEDFDLSSKLIGRESLTWVDLLEYRRKAEFPGLSFYVDKVARRRWMDSKGLDSPNAFLSKYATELSTENTTTEIQALLPEKSDYVAKPTHLSCSGGVWLTKSVGNKTYVGNGKKPMKEDAEFTTLNIANDLAHNLQKVMTTCGSRPESVALQNVKPGIMVEERYSSLESSDDRGAMEFKRVFEEGGRLWMAGYKIGNYKVVADTEVPTEFLKSGMVMIH
ncbi:MAG: hypothetical protein SGILL_001817 [Bacillariaceae sp.]